ncbi:sugar transferase [Oculatella sp. LEGE 06141]|uniref:Npun_R2821/Npun_R2822 family protein n=1 Tax=Oculatella sp. LEGE 06141 TaxID=1828648 RepID=UPI00187F355F|nr:Npun_R2821/Npun_R2822 family protein [Oculatella sp. LEGE 06141]MBE9181551.1 sugar transferase [Oculatella sp. LEGE 06141]
MTDGIYTLANDVVYDQLVALLNSIEVNAGAAMPVCVIAYDHQLDRVRAEVARRDNVTLLDDPELFARWEDFSMQVWKTHANALQRWQQQGIEGVYRLSCNHRYAAFDPAAPFDRFIYLDADTLLLSSPAVIFDSLDRHDFVVYDFQYKDPSHIFNINSSRLVEVFPKQRLESEIFCSGCYASKRGLFAQEQLDWIVDRLAEGESEVLYLNAPNQSVLNYMTLRAGIPVHNLAIHLPEDQRTGNAVTSTHFEMNHQTLYDHGKPLTYLHYIGLSSKLFRRLCAGENLAIPYRDIFLDYRFLHEPEQRPVLSGKPNPIHPKPSLTQRMMRKLGISG